MHLGFALLTLAPGQVGGSESVARALLAEYRAGRGPARVSLLGDPEVLAPLAGGPVAVRPMRAPGTGAIGARRAAGLLAATLRQGRGGGDLDVVHYVLTVPLPRTSAATVLTLHDVQHIDLPRLFPAAERAWRRFAYDRAARRASLVVTPSEHARTRGIEALGLDPERVVAIPHGIDASRFSAAGKDDERLLADLRLPPRFVVYPANLWPHKNHGRLVDALARTADDELALVLTGETYGRLPALEAHAERLGVAHRLRHLGYLPGAKVAALYRAARAMVFPSLYEGFGSPPLEAMACGVPVASSTRASLAEVVGDAAARFDPDDPAAIAAAIDRVTADESERARLIAAGRQRAAGFTWERSARAHVRAYERATAG